MLSACSKRRCLGVIPQNIGYLMDEGTESKHAEAYRVLRTNLLFSRKDEKLNTIVIVSAGAGEGKSTTTINLATVFAQAGNRILVVDSDLRRPTLHKLFKVSQQPRSDQLSAQAEHAGRAGANHPGPESRLHGQRPPAQQFHGHSGLGPNEGNDRRIEAAL